MSTLAVTFCFAITDDAPATAAQASLTREETARWLAVGQGRARFQEFVFPEVPEGELDVALHTNTSVQRYRVTEQDRSRLIRVCNPEA